MARWLGPPRARWSWRLSLTLVLGLALAGILYIVTGAHRHFVSKAAAQGWRIEGGSEEVGLLSSTIRGARLSWQNAPGLVADIERIEIRHWPWVQPRMTFFHIRARLNGEAVVLLRALQAAARWQDPPLVIGPVEVSYDHRLLGPVELDGVTMRPNGSTTVLQAEHVQVGRYAWRAVTLAFEPRQEMFVIVPGDSVAHARVQLSCFPSSSGQARWLFDIVHQPARPLADWGAWDLGGALDAARVAGSVSFDIPDDAAQPLRGRVQLVLDGWATRAPASAQPWLGNTLSLLSNLVPAADGRGWDLPRAELSLPVFELVGKGHIQLGDPATFSLAAKGERTCRQVQALLPPSEARRRLGKFLDGRPSKAAPSDVDDHVGLGLRWPPVAGALSQPEWQFHPGCGADAWLDP